MLRAAAADADARHARGIRGAYMHISSARDIRLFIRERHVSSSPRVRVLRASGDSARCLRRCVLAMMRCAMMTPR